MGLRPGAFAVHPSSTLQRLQRKSSVTKAWECHPIRAGSAGFAISRISYKSDLLEKASEIVTDPLVLINLVSQRVRQLNSGRSPLIPVRPSMGVADIALTEIIEGKIQLVEKVEA